VRLGKFDKGFADLELYRAVIKPQVNEAYGFRYSMAAVFIAEGVGCINAPVKYVWPTSR
jgi:hypothetical protein